MNIFVSNKFVSNSLIFCNSYYRYTLSLVSSTINFLLSYDIFYIVRGDGWE